MKIIRTLTTAFMLLLHLGATAQHDEGAAYISILVSPSGALVRLDTTRITGNGIWQPVTPGTHRVRAWAQGYGLLDSTVFVGPGDSLRFRKLLHHSPRYIEYRIALRRHNAPRARASLLAGMIPAMGATALLVNVHHAKRMDEAAGIMLTHRDNYHSSFQADYIAEQKAAYQEWADVYYRSRRIRLLTNTGFVVLGTAAVLLIRDQTRRYKRSTKPVYQEDAPLARLDINLDWQPSQPLLAGFTYHF